MLLTSGCSQNPVSTDPDVLYWDADVLKAMRHDYATGGPGASHPVWKGVHAHATEILSLPLPTVTENSAIAASGDPNDYFSVGRYFWPNPDSEDGLPWSQRDGQINPDVTASQFDQEVIARLSAEMKALILAYFITQEERFAEAAVNRLQCWFVTPETRMNPHLRFAQSVPGVRDGSRFGLIEGMEFVEILNAIGMLEGSDAYTEAIKQPMRIWFNEYLGWLQTSEAGIAERFSDNNHGTYMDCQLVCYSWWLGQHRQARKYLKDAKQLRINDHIAADGSQPREMRRTRTFMYHTYNLNGLCTLAMMGDRYGADLWHAHDSKMRLALDFLMPYVDPTIEWPHAETNMERSKMTFTLRQAAVHYQDLSYLEAMRRIPGHPRSAWEDWLWPPERIPDKIK